MWKILVDEWLHFTSQIVSLPSSSIALVFPTRVSWPFQLLDSSELCIYKEDKMDVWLYLFIYSFSFQFLFLFLSFQNNLVSSHTLLIFSNLPFILFVCVCLCVSVCVPSWVYRTLVQMLKEGRRMCYIPWSWSYRWLSVTWRESWEQMLGPLEDQEFLSTPDLSLQPLIVLMNTQI